MTFFFKKASGTKRDSLIFSKYDRIFELNFETKEIKTIYEYQETEKMKEQPQYFQVNDA